MVDQREFRHAFARLLHLVGDGGFLAARRSGPAVQSRTPGAGRDRLRGALHLDQGTSAVARSTNRCGRAEARNSRAPAPRTPATACTPRHVRPLTLFDDDFCTFLQLIRRDHERDRDSLIVGFRLVRILRRCGPRSRDGRWRIRPWTGRGRASPSAQMDGLRPAWSTSSSRSISLLRAALRPCGCRTCATSSRCPRGTACTGRSSRACRSRRCARMAAMMSVDLSMTMTAACPCRTGSLDSVSKSSVRSCQMIGSAGTASRADRESPPAGCPSRRRTPPA